MMGRIRSSFGFLIVMAGLGVSCAGADVGAPPVATPSLVMGDTATIGSPIELTYRFAVAADAPPFVEDHRVFVHFLDTDGE